MNDKIEKYKPLLKVIQKVKPKTFKALVDAVALQNQSAAMVNVYVINRKIPDKISFYYPPLSCSLEASYGLILYREQIHQIMNQMASLTADELSFIEKAQCKKQKEKCEQALQLLSAKAMANETFTANCSSFNLSPQTVIKEIWRTTLANAANTMKYNYAIQTACEFYEAIFERKGMNTEL